jgi:hypothetical protein
MWKKIKPFREWKKERKKILRAKGIKISKITDGDWKRRYGAAKWAKRPHYWCKGKKNVVVSKSQKKLWKNRKYRSKMLKKINSPESIKKRSLAQKGNKFSRSHLKALRLANSSPLKRKKNSLQMKRVWRRKGYKKKMKFIFKELAKEGKCGLQQKKCRRNAVLYQKRMAKQGKHISQTKKWKKMMHKRMSGNRNPSKRPEVRKKIGDAHRGVPLTSRALRNIRKAARDPKKCKKARKSQIKFWASPKGKKLAKERAKKNKGKHLSPERLSQMRKIYKNPRRNKKIREAKIIYWSDPKKREEQRNKFKGRRAVWWDGKNNPNWKGGCSSNGYPPLFLNPRYRELVRERFGRKCMICFHPEFGLNGNGKKLFVHHINYKRTDCRFNNLIPLHNSCHSRTNFKDNANQWEKYFRNIMKTLTN